MMPLAVLASVGLYVAGRSRRGVSVAATVGGLLVIAFLGVRSWAQSASWYNFVTLWSHALEHGSGGTGELHSNMAIVHMMMGDAGKALAELDQAVRLSPGLAEVHRNYATVLARLGRHAEARDRLRRAVLLRPDFHQARADLAAALTRAGRHAEATREYEAVARGLPGSADALARLGTALRREEREAQARERFLEALRLNPSHPEALRGLRAVEVAGRERPATPTP
jgi:Tfp pilus assembly protein PilF